MRGLPEQDGAVGGRRADALRVPAIDVLRASCVVAVVVLHATSLWLDSAQPATGVVVVNGLLLWAIPSIFVISGFVTGRGPHAAHGPRWLGRRVLRLVTPYVGWTAIYLGLISWRTVSSGNGWPPYSVRDFLLGEMYPLFWFLPTLIYVSILAWPIRSRRTMAIVCIVGHLAWPTLWLAGMEASQQVSDLAGYAAGVARFLGLYAGGMWIAGLDPRTLRRLQVPAAVSAAIFVAGQAFLNTRLSGVGATVPGLYQEALGSAAGLCIVALVAGIALQRAHPAVAYGLGLYMTHMLWGEIATRLVPAGALAWPAWVGLASAFMFAGSAATIWLMARNRRLRPLIA